MEFLKEVLGDGYAALETAVKEWNEKPENKEKQIKIVNAASGAYVSKSKYDALEIEKNGIFEQLNTATENLKKFEGIEDPTKLQSEITRLSGELETQKSTYEEKIADMKFTAALEAAITAAGGRSAKAISALLDVDSLKDSKNQENDIKTAIETCKTQNEYLFGSDEPIKNPIGPTGDPLPGGKKLEDMSYEEYKAYRQGK